METAARRTDTFIGMSRRVVPVAVTPTILFAAVNIRSYEAAIIFIDNDGTDVFTGTIEFSPNGVFPGTIEQDGAFSGMAVGGPTRWVRIPVDAQWVRVSGTFAVTPGNIRVSVMLQRGA